MMKLETRICKETIEGLYLIRSIYDMLYQPVLGQVIKTGEVEYVVISINDTIYDDAIYRYVYVK